VVIPDKATTPSYPVMPSKAYCYSITIQNGGILNAQANAQLTVNGTTNAFLINESGTFNPSNSTVIFTANKDLNGVVTLSGNLGFHHLTISDGSEIQLQSNSNLSISGFLFISLSGNLDATTFQNTITYLGDGQSIPTPNGGSSGYYSLRISGSGAMFPLGVTRCMNLEVGSEGDVIVPAGSGLTVTGSLEVVDGGKLYVRSDDLQSGSLIVEGSAVGNILYDRFLTAEGVWHLVSFPVSESPSAFLSALFNEGVVAQDRDRGVYSLAQWDEQQRDWCHFPVANPGGNVVAGLGYEILLTDTTPPEVRFEGPLFLDEEITVGSPSTTPLNPGWNLVGNPFPCFLSYEGFLTANSENISATHCGLYCWDPLTNGYEVVNYSCPATIAPGQGFFVHVATGAESVSFPSTLRTHVSGSFKSSGTWPSVSLTAQTGSVASHTLLRFVPGTTAGLDPGFDAGRFDQGETFALATRMSEDHRDNQHHNTIDYQLQCLPDGTWENLMVPLKLRTPQGSTVTFTLEQQGLPDQLKWFIEDRATGLFTRLDEPGSSMTINFVTAYDDIGRFFLWCSSAPGSSITGYSDLFTITPIPQQGKIRITGPVALPAHAILMDLSGRTVASEVLSQPFDNEISYNQAECGVYILKIESSRLAFGKKFFWTK
ncbi:MAG: hypothetical protein PHY21_10465, partial [Candidatus Cloacimonetes bacterium]|nr:hypothetical protein [Candidatus Cloacimonadota bacterium]